MKRKILTLAILSSLSTAAFSQSSSPQTNSDLKVTAVVKAGCDLTADNINFGVLMMPLTDQSAQSDIQIKCSKGANLDIAIKYSDAVSSGGTYTSKIKQTGSNTWSIYENGEAIGDIACTIHQNIVKTYFWTNAVRNLFDVNAKIGTWIPDTYNLCSNESYSQLNTNTINNLNGYGSLTGLTAGEQIKFLIEKPSEANIVWTTNNKYAIQGTGNTQIIPMKAKIKRSDNVTYRMTPDTYQSTLIVVLSY